MMSFKSAAFSLNLQGIICGIIFFSIISGILSGPAEKRLLQYLFDPNRLDAHNLLERPTAIDSQPLWVELKVTLQQIIDVDEKNQILNTNIWLDMAWNDYHFKWNPADYENITVLIVPPKTIWRPDILMYNSADDKFDGTYPTNVIINNEGNIQYIPPGMFKSTCHINITWFPFDSQTCILKFGSWTYNGMYIDLRLKCSNQSDPNCSNVGTGDITNFIENGEWDLIGVPAIRNVKKYECCEETFIDLEFSIKIQRRALYYTFNLIVPCILISTMSLLVFILPPDAGEKISLGVTIMLSLTMFLLLVADAMPQTSGAVPLIGMYFSCIMVMCSFSVAFTVLVLNYHHRSSDGEDVPYWIKTFVNIWLAKFLFMRRRHDLPSIEDPKPKRSPNMRNGAGLKGTENDLKERSSRSLLANVLDLDDDFRVKTLNASAQLDYCHFAPYFSNSYDVPPGQSSSMPTGDYPSTEPQLHGTSNSFCTTKMELYNIIKELRFITTKIRQDEQHSLRANEWKFAARVIDRFCLIMFSIFTITSSCAILLRPVDEEL